jgi:hypothetical protein
MKILSYIILLDKNYLCLILPTNPWDCFSVVGFNLVKQLRLI